MKAAILMALITIAPLISCSDESPVNTFQTDCGNTSASFSSDILPIISSSCATSSGCHGSSSSAGPGALTNYAQISAAKNSISGAVGSGFMPKDGSLTADQKNKILCWIQNGGLNN